jgi:hypothetical protein
VDITELILHQRHEQRQSFALLDDSNNRQQAVDEHRVDLPCVTPGCISRHPASSDRGRRQNSSRLGRVLNKPIASLP